ncbi:efflux transporter outer membrane subunit [Telmatospirillum siberiense]|uniref:Multidrug transporter n=1 Tax=Telmatospirillum siberiense TaxID=382514 RepID=A0A2N3PZ61_9PROT|nr:efflux transporter outer membrane subunit [Telmatospirillum siberiense]PKU25697.1 multidrug transporter [Telmatospirillum siberiense]
MMLTKRLLPLAAGALLLAGCSLIPSYDRPAAPISSIWPLGRAEEPVAPVADIGWREFFTDPRLQKLIELSLSNNRDLRVAALNVEAARAQYQIQRADLFPSISASASGLNERVPARLSSSGKSVIEHQYSASVGFTSYELDLFGRIRSLTEQELELYFVEEETRTSTQITLVAEVADAYLTLMSDQELLRLTKETLDSQRKTYDLTKRSRDFGASTELELRQVETSVRTAEANLAQYDRQVSQDRNALVLLVGQPLPADLDADLAKGHGLDDASLLADLPAGLPSELLERRPDIRAAEHNLKAANANIGAARAAFFPTVTLTASGGTSDTSLSRLFQGPTRAWTFNPSISVPIFEAGKLEADLDYAKVQKNIQVAQYEKAIQTAFREVSDSLVALQTYEDQVRADAALVEASEVRYKLADLRFRNGVDGYLNTLDAQRSLYSAQQSLISIRLSRLSNLVTLYKTLGGGWSEHTATAQVELKTP